MKLTYNDIRYIISETTKRIVTEGYGSNKETEDVYVGLEELIVNPVFEDELDMYDGESEVHMVCTYRYNEERRGDWDTPGSNPSYTLVDITPEDNEELESSLSNEAYMAVLDAAAKYIWDNREDYEMGMMQKRNDYREYEEDWYYETKGDEDRMNRIGY